MDQQQPSSAPNTEKKPQGSGTPVKQENLFLNLGCNLILPMLILNKGEKWFSGILTPYIENTAVGILLIAIAFPIGYFIYDLVTRSKCNLISIVGLFSVLLTGLFGVLQLPVEWFPYKEAAFPAVIGIGIIISSYTKNSFCKALILNPDISNADLIKRKLHEHNCLNAFEKLVRRCNWLMVVSFILSALINYLLAKWIVISPTGTPEFNAEVSKMMWVTFFAMLIPGTGLMMFAGWRLFVGIKKMTGLQLEEIFNIADEDKTKDT